MKTSSKAQAKCVVELKVTIDDAEAKAIVKDVEKAFAREAQVPGFRKGKVPMDLIRKDFANQLKEEEARSMVRKYYADAVKAEKLDEVNLKGISELKVDENGGEMTALVEVKPTFKLPTYKGLKIAAANTIVDDAKIAERIEAMKVQFAKYEDAKEGDSVQTGDFAQIDYNGGIDGKSILELAPDAKVVAEGKGYWMRVEEGYFLPELVEAVKGMKVGEEKCSIPAHFDKETAPDALKGKDAMYTMKLTAFRRRVLPTDEELVKATKDESMDALVKKTREAMEKQTIEAETRRRENEAIELLLKKVDFDVPESQVQAQMNGYLNDLAQRAQYMGLTAEYFEKNREQILKDAEENATKQVRLWYVIDAIAKEEKLEAKDEEKGKKVIELILANAK